MKLTRALLTVAFTFSVVSAASSWSFTDATLQIAGKGAEAVKHKFTPNSPVSSSSPITLPPSQTLKIVLTAQEGKTGNKPHQAFLNLQDLDTGLEESFAFSVKDNGKAKLDVVRIRPNGKETWFSLHAAWVPQADLISHEQASKDLPFQFLTSTKPLKASIILASFGSSTPYHAHAFNLNIESDPASPPAVPSPPERYASKPEIHHVFREDSRSPPKVLSLFFTLSIIVTLPALIGVWLVLGGNLNHLSKAFGANPLAHGLFFGSIVAMEGVFFLYYSSWNLFQTLPVAAVVGAVAYVSGSRALTEVQERRLAGER